jgi:hypothetical protein
MPHDVSQKSSFTKVLAQVAKRMIGAHWCRVRFQPRSLVSGLGTLVTRLVLVADATIERPQLFLKMGEDFHRHSSGAARMVNVVNRRDTIWNNFERKIL